MTNDGHYPLKKWTYIGYSDKIKRFFVRNGRYNEIWYTLDMHLKYCRKGESRPELGMQLACWCWHISILIFLIAVLGTLNIYKRVHHIYTVISTSTNWWKYKTETVLRVTQQQYTAQRYSLQTAGYLSVEAYLKLWYWVKIKCSNSYIIKHFT